MFNLVSSIPPITSEFVGETGLEIEANVHDYYQVNEGACVQIFVFNRSNGKIMSEGDVSCRVYLSDHNGTNVLSGSPIAYEDHFKMCRLANIVHSTEIYDLAIVCNSSNLGGYKTHFFEATNTGYELTEAKAIFYLGFLFLLVLIFFVNIFSIPFIPSDDYNEEQELISINMLKHLKPILFTTAYGIFMSIMFVGSNLAFAYLNTELLAKTLFMVYKLMFLGLLPAIIISSTYILYRAVEDAKQIMLNKRGFVNDGI